VIKCRVLCERCDSSPFFCICSKSWDDERTITSMELNYDWKCFQFFFISKRKPQNTDLALGSRADGEGSPIYVLTQGNQIIVTLSHGESLVSWSGATFDELEARFPNREMILFDREKVDQWLSQSSEGEHYYDQILYLCTEARPQFTARSKTKSFGLAFQKNFLLKLLKSRWSVFFPVSYGILVCLDGDYSRSIFLRIHRSRIQSFVKPDFSTMIPERRKVFTDLVRHLAESELIPVQGVFVSSENWNEWSAIENPWEKISLALRRDRTQLSPFRWGVVFLIFIRAKFKLFNRPS
jgi:hypothetical protein